MERFLRAGGCKVDRWFQEIGTVKVAFDDEVAFTNINTRDELAHTYIVRNPAPLTWEMALKGKAAGF